MISPLKKGLWFAMFVLANTLLNAQGAKLKGIDFSDVVNGTTYYGSVEVNDQFYPGPPPSDYRFVSQDCSVIFEFKQDQNILLSGEFEVSIEFDVEIITTSGATVNHGSQRLLINYNSAPGISYRDIHLLKFEDVRWINVTLSNVQFGKKNSLLVYEDIDDLITLSLELEHENYYDFNFHKPDGVGHSHLNYSNELVIDWDYNLTAVEYELEWTFVSNDDGNGGTLSDSKYNFKNNASRISTTQNQYEIPLIYESGWIVYRVRAVGRIYEKDEYYRVFGQWSIPEYGAVNASHDKFLFSGHEENLNWQYSINFAEEGKRKVVLSYHDGTLRNRQIVSNINSIDKSVVAETIYDFEGRPAIEILPTPIENSSLNYVDNFNTYNSHPITAAHFDVDNSECTPHSIALDLQSGASRYYSSFNNSSSPFRDFIPDSEGHPYIQTQFTKDKTGRIRKKSGLGLVHKLGSNHEIVNYFENASDERLTRLFGTQVGNDQHYSRSLVKDANGQYLVSYLDLKGNVIATSILGDVPASLQELTPYYYLNKDFIEEVETELVSENNTSNSNGELSVSIQKALPYSTDVVFNYELTVPAYTDTCLPENTCFNCVYELDISFIDECGVDYEGIEQVIQLGEYNEGQSCVSETHIIAPLKLKQQTFNEGLYSIGKTLQVSPEAIKFYADLFIESNDCLLNYDHFLIEELDAIDFSLCNIICCDSSNNDSQQIVEGLDYQTSTHTILCGDDSLSEKYSDFIEACNKTVSVCSNTLAILKADFSPGGQYATYEINSMGNYFTNDPTSIFHSNSLTTTYKNKDLHYLDEFGDPALVNGQTPQQLSIEEYILHFDLSWADALVEYHPEYCFTGFCDIISESDDYDFNLINIQTHLDGYPYYQAINNSANGIATSNSSFEDPIWNILPANYRDELALKLNTFSFANSGNNSFQAQNIWQTALTIATQQLQQSPQGTQLIDLQWSTFIGLYMSTKQQVIEEYKEQYLINNNCCNTCIGNADYKGDVCCKENKWMTPLQCCDITAACACMVKAPFFAVKKKRFLTFEDAFNLAGIDVNDLESISSVVEHEVRDCCEKYEKPFTKPEKIGQLSEDGYWIVVLGDGIDEKFTWRCNLLAPYCEQVLIKTTPYVNTCVEGLVNLAKANANTRYKDYIQFSRLWFIETYTSQCLKVEESFVMITEEKEYHHTLYYYDQANNLVCTVPPRAVNPISQNSTTTDPAHDFTLDTRYSYNSLNQLIYEDSPDGGLTQIWYDIMGRAVLTQNAVQRPHDKFTYTRYDNLNRVFEVGELTTTEALSKHNGLVIYNIFESAYCRPQSSLDAFIDNATTTQITHTIYDFKVSSVSNNFDGGQQNLRSRISGITIDDDGNGVYEYGTFYSYDIHGNVKELLQHNNDLPTAIANDYQYKILSYEYDLISGNVHTVKYQDGKEDQFHHKYLYDAENRITDVETSSDGVIWTSDARYFYYDHGPLARLELGDDNVQGIDYAYNIQGWIKGVNSTSLTPETDMGHDGLDNVSNSNSTFAKDVFSYGLSYYNGDYKPIGVTNSFTPQENTGMDNEELFNGNIRNMTASIDPFMSDGGVFGSRYRYDQLNRITSMRSFQGHNPLTNTWVSESDNTSNSSYNSRYEYDPNGNLKSLNRNTLSGISMDELSYDYYPETNQLQFVDDPAGIKNNDIGSQNSGNYKYDEIGNLVSDVSEKINFIEWNMYGKIRSIDKVGVPLSYAYDPIGNRIKKETNATITWYVRDATGNVMGVYEWDKGNLKHYLKEQTIYGVNRLGVLNLNKELIY